jgi:hypothetical protein
MITPRPSELPAATDCDQTIARTACRVGQLLLVASEHAAAGRPGHARRARMLIALQDELYRLNATRRATPP